MTESRPPAAERIWRAWEDWWFPRSDGLDLAICRILVVGALLLFFLPSLDHHTAYAFYNDEFYKPRAFIELTARLLDPIDVRSVRFVTGAYVTTVAAGVLTLFGLATRASALVLALGYLFLVTHQYSYGDVHHPETLSAIFLMILPFSPCGRRLSLDALLARSWRRRSGQPARQRETREAAWPLVLMRLVIGLAYLNAAYSKLSRSGLDWVNGYNLQENLLAGGLFMDWPLALWIAQHYWLCVALSVATIAFEGLFILAVFWRRSTPFWLLAGVAFHVGLAVMRRGHPGFFAWVVLYAVFVDFRAVAARASLWLRAGTSERSRERLASAVPPQ